MSEPLRHRPGDQPLPVVNNFPFVHDLVIRDLARQRDSGAIGFDTFNLVITDVLDRKTLGTARYGTPLQPFNGRNTLRDLYEELLDAAAYYRSYLYEHEVDPFAYVIKARAYRTLLQLAVQTRHMMQVREHREHE